MTWRILLVPEVSSCMSAHMQQAQTVRLPIFYLNSAASPRAAIICWYKTLLEITIHLKHIKNSIMSASNKLRNLPKSLLWQISPDSFIYPSSSFHIKLSCHCLGCISSHHGLMLATQDTNGLPSLQALVGFATSILPAPTFHFPPRCVPEAQGRLPALGTTAQCQNSKSSVQNWATLLWQ